MDFEIKLIKGNGKGYFVYLYSDIENVGTAADNHIIKFLNITSDEYYKRLKNICDVYKVKNGIFIKKNINNEEFVEKFKKEFMIELTMQKLSDGNLDDII